MKQELPLQIQLQKIQQVKIEKEEDLRESSETESKDLQIMKSTFNELKNYIESLFEPWMNWNNWGKYDVKTWNDNDQSTWVWNLDHIVPLHRHHLSV